MMNNSEYCNNVLGELLHSW